MYSRRKLQRVEAEIRTGYLPIIIVGFDERLSKSVYETNFDLIGGKKEAQKRGYNMELLAEVIRLLASGETLPKIKITHCRANMAVAESVTFCRIGC